MIATPCVADVPWTLERGQLEAWLRACGDHATRAAPAGGWAPPMAVVLASVPLVVTPLLQALALQLRARPGALLHGDEEIVWHRPLRVGEAYLASGQVLSRAQSPLGVALRIGAELCGQDGAPVVTTRSSFLFTPVAPFASGDANPLHLSDAEAQALGLQRRPLQGMCSLAFAARSLLAMANAAATPWTLRRLRGRFRRPVYPGDALLCRSTARAVAGHHGFRIVNQQGEAVVARGAAELIALADAATQVSDRAHPQGC